MKNTNSCDSTPERTVDCAVWKEKRSGRHDKVHTKLGISGTHHDGRSLISLKSEVHDALQPLSRRMVPVPLFEQSRVAESVEVWKLGPVAEDRRRFAGGWTVNAYWALDREHPCGKEHIVGPRSLLRDFIKSHQHRHSTGGAGTKGHE